MMEYAEYIVLRIDGDYAVLQRTDEPSDDDVFIARALLPAEAGEGTRLKCEWFSYSLL